MKKKIIEILKNNQLEVCTPTDCYNVIYDDYYEDIAVELIEEIKRDTKRAYNEGYEDGFKDRNGAGACTSEDSSTSSRYKNNL